MNPAAPVRRSERRHRGGNGGGAQTSDERRQSGEKSLDDSLGDFDKTLKKEQERVAKERDAQGMAAPKAKAASDRPTMLGVTAAAAAEHPDGRAMAI